MSTINNIRRAGLKFYLFFLLLFVGSGFFVQTTAQPVRSATSQGLSGSGVAYIGGPEATFWNPANLMIGHRPGEFHLTTGSAAMTLNPVLPSASIHRQLNSFGDAYLPYEPGSAQITDRERQKIVRMHYPDNKLLSTHRQQVDLMLAGALWSKEDYSLSIALRGRYGSTIRVGRGWYDHSFIPNGNQHIRDFSLIHRRSELYELAVGYAQEFTFINGLLSDANKLYIGITPKLIVAGPHLTAQYQARYLQEDNQTIQPIFNDFTSEFHLQSSGNGSRAINQYRRDGRPQQAINDHFNKSYSFKPTGYGLGFDFGLNYLIPLGSGSLEEQTSKSLRVALSLNDIGAVRYHEQPLTLDDNQDTTEAILQSPVQQMFNGAGGQLIDYLHRPASLPNPLFSTTSPSRESYTAPLPTSVNAGILLDLKRIRLMGDLIIGLDNTAFTSTEMIINLGLEARPLKQVPLRLGTTLAKSLPLTVGLGTGLETKHWDFNVGARLLFQSHSPKAYFAGGAFGGLQLHF